MTQKTYNEMTLDELTELEAKLTKDIVYLDNQNLAVKVLLNSIYGTFANKHSSLMDIDNAMSITITGQNVARAGGTILDDYVRSHYGITDSITKYGDTDSLIGTTIIRTNEGEISIENLYNKFARSKHFTTKDGHELLEVRDLNIKVPTYCSFSKNAVWGRVERLIRHKVSKKKYCILTVDGKEVVMTEDHGCMVMRDNCLIRIKPSKVDIRDDLFVILTDINMMSHTLVRIASVEHTGDFQDEYVYDIEMSDDTEHTFFANDVLVHNSVYVSIDSVLKKLGLELAVDGKVTEEVHDIVNKLDEHVNIEILNWARKELKSIDPRYVFKREIISDVGIFLQKKRYILHVLDEEGVATDKFKYTGIELVRSTTPKKVKVFIENVIKTSLLTQNIKNANEVYRNAYDSFLKLDPNDVASRTSINNLEKYMDGASLYKYKKGTPSHVKGAIAYNILIKQHKIDDRYESIQSAQKVKKIYCAKNKYGLDAISYVSSLPEEFGIKVDWDKMFSKLVTQPVDRLYEAIGWSLPEIGKEVQTDLFEMFGGIS